MKAIYNDVVIAESDATTVVEGNHYFPPESIKREFFSDSGRTTVCSWKGTANYYNITVADQESKNAAWYYANPSEAARELKGFVAFYPVVKIVP